MNFHIHIFEILSITFSLGTTFLTINQKAIRWPIDIFILLLNLYIHHKVNLLDRWIFSSVILMLDFYGWYNWIYGGPNKSLLKVKRLSSFPKSLIKIILFGIISVIILYFFLYYIKSDFPFIGSFRTIFSWIALWLATNKRQEHWFFWIILNLLSIYLYIKKGLFLFSFKYLIYTFLNFYGFYKWKKSMIMN